MGAKVGQFETMLLVKGFTVVFYVKIVIAFWQVLSPQRGNINQIIEEISAPFFWYALHEPKKG